MNSKEIIEDCKLCEGKGLRKKLVQGGGMFFCWSYEIEIVCNRCEGTGKEKIKDEDIVCLPE